MPNKNNCLYFCSRCRHPFNRLDKFKQHTIHREHPSKKCVSKIPHPISWITYCQDAEDQIHHYKLKKQYKYIRAPTDEQVAMLQSKGNDLHFILRYHINKPFYKPVVDKWFEKKKRAGYEILRVRKGREMWESEEFVYLVKDGIIYCPYKKNKELIIVGHVEEAYYQKEDVRIMNDKSPEFKQRYNCRNCDTVFTHGKNVVKNFYKIDPQYQVVHIDEEERVWVDTGLDHDNLKYIICEDRTVFEPNTDKRPPYGVDGTYYNISFSQNTKKFVYNDIAHQQQIITTDCGLEKMVHVIKAFHNERGFRTDTAEAILSK